MTDLPELKEEFIPRRKKPQIVTGSFEKITTVSITGSRHCEVFDGVVKMPVQAYFLVI
jgi:hypothetical protein